MLWLVIVTVILLFLQSMLFSTFAFKRLFYSRAFDRKACFVGEEVGLIETIMNRKILPLPWVILESTIPASLRFHTSDNLKVNEGTVYQYHRSFFSLLPYTKIRRKHRMICMKRGCYRLRSVSITTGDPFGFHKISRGLKFHTELLVYPEILEYDQLPMPNGWMGEMTSKRPTSVDPFMISGTREYGPGDPMNQIHWKATARTGELQVHQRDYTADQKLMVFLNFEITENMWDSVTDPLRIEQAIKYAASYVTHLINSGGVVGFGCNGLDIDKKYESVYVSAGSGRRQLLKIYETMARLIIERSSDTFASLLKQEVGRHPRHTDYILLTSFVNEAIEQQIERLRQLGNQVHLVWLDKENEEVRSYATTKRNVS